MFNSLADSATTAAWFDAWGQWASVALAALVLIPAVIAGIRRWCRPRDQQPNKIEADRASAPAREPVTVPAVAAPTAEDAALTEKRNLLLDAQLEEIRRGQTADARAAEAEARRQAERLNVEWTSSSLPPPGIALASGDEVHAVLVDNQSGRPFMDVRAGIRFTGTGEKFNEATAHGINHRARGTLTMGEQQLTQNNRLNFAKPGDQHLFLFSYSVGANRYAEMAVRFVDAAGKAWQVNPDYSLVELDRDQWMY